MKPSNNLYIGIDLGTTNSCIAWGAFNAISQRITPEIIPIRMAGVPTAQQLIPSVAMYKTGQKYPIAIGVSAKQQLLHGRVELDSTIIRSVKLQMGKESVKEAPWLSPEEVSADILKVLKENIERKFGFEQSSVVIGVPACFNVDMWRATERAAQITGFKQIHLIDEPKAALLDFIDIQNQLIPESRVLDFTEPKMICVFDPGGGTLDVSLVQVKQNPVTRGGRLVNEIEYEDLGLTRQPFLGGDDFDILLANFLKKKFAVQTGINIDEIQDESLKRHAFGTLLEYTEDAKKNLADQVNDAVTIRDMSEEEAINQAYTDIVILYLYKTYGLNYRLTYREYMDIVRPLLGWDLELADIERNEIQRKLIYQEEMQKSENIIMPIFDALLKAKKKLGFIPKIDAVLISGGLSKLQVIQQRLRKLFGNNVVMVEASSPDLSVARGASLHHYNLVNGLDRTSSLLPEAISLEVGGAFVQLVAANTQYPTAQPIIPSGFQLAIPETGIPYIDIPLWRGEPPLPTAKLVDRRIDLKDKVRLLQKGDLVNIEITIDSNRHLRFNAWLQRNPDVRFEVTTVMS